MERMKIVEGIVSFVSGIIFTLGGYAFCKVVQSILADVVADEAAKAMRSKLDSAMMKTNFRLEMLETDLELQNKRVLLLEKRK